MKDHLRRRRLVERRTITPRAATILFLVTRTMSPPSVTTSIEFPFT
jgi:hypothetical protein